LHSALLARGTIVAPVSLSLMDRESTIPFLYCQLVNSVPFTTVIDHSCLSLYTLLYLRIQRHAMVFFSISLLVDNTSYSLERIARYH
jgi:hypothetical protein